MALESATSNGTTDENHPEEKDEWKEGWLFKKTHYTMRWKLVWCHIRDGQLIYGFNEKVRVNDAGLLIKPRTRSSVGLLRNNSDQLICINFSTPVRAV